MDQRLTQSMMDLRRTPPRGKAPKGSVSPLHDEPKFSRRSVSPLPNQEKTPRASPSPFRGSVSPLPNQVKTPRGSVSPFRGGPVVSPLPNQVKTTRGSVVYPLPNQVKTPRGSVSPYRGGSVVSPSPNQVKTPRGYVSPLHNQAKTPRGSVSPLHSRQKVSLGSVSPLHNNQVKTPKASVSPLNTEIKPPSASVSPLRTREKDPISSDSSSHNHENPKRDSASPLQNTEKPLPNYLKTSSSTCHDICKYGSRHGTDEEKGKNIVLRRKSTRIKLRSLSSGKIVFSEKIELISVESSNSNEEANKTVEWKDIKPYDASNSIRGEIEEEEEELENPNIKVEKNPKLVEKKNKKQIIRIKDVYSKTKEIESKSPNLDDVKNPNFVEKKNTEQGLRLTNRRNNIDEERTYLSKARMDSKEKKYDIKDDKEATTSKSRSDENYTKVPDKFKPRVEKYNTADMNKHTKEKKYLSSKDGEKEFENPNLVERKKNKDAIIDEDKEINNLEKKKKDVYSKAKLDSNKKPYNTKGDKEASTSKSKLVNEDSRGKFRTKLDISKSIEKQPMEKQNTTNMYRLSKEKNSPKKKSLFSFTRISNGRRSHEGKNEKVVSRPKLLNKPSSSSTIEPKEKTLHMIEPKSRKINLKSIISKPKEEQENPLKPEKSKFRRGKVVDLPPDPNSPRKLRFRNKRGSNENLSGFQIGRRSLRRKGSIGSGSSNSNGHIVMLKHNDTPQKKGLQGLFNSIIEETVNKLVKTRKSKVKALVGAFETVISLQDNKSMHVD